MTKFIYRIVALLLVPCLAMEPSLAGAAPKADLAIGRRIFSIPAVMALQAIPPAEAVAFTKPALSQRTIALIENTADRLRQSLGLAQEIHERVRGILWQVALNQIPGWKAAAAFLRLGVDIGYLDPFFHQLHAAFGMVGDQDRENGLSSLAPFSVKKSEVTIAGGRRIPVTILRASANQVDMQISVQALHNGDVDFRRNEFTIYMRENDQFKPIPFADRALFQLSHAEHVSKLAEHGPSGLGIPTNNLYLNRDHMVWSDGTLYHAALDPVKDRPYSAIIQWKTRRLTIQWVQFRPLKDGRFQILVERVPYNVVRWRNVSDQVNQAVIGIPLVSDGGMILTPNTAYRWDDLGHLFRFPEYEVSASPGQKPIRRPFGLAQLYEELHPAQGDASFHRTAQLLFGNSITLDLPLDSAERESLIRSLRDPNSGYREDRTPINAGEYRIMGTRIQIVFQRARYTFSLIGLTSEPKPELLVSVVEGWAKDPQNASGLTAEEAAEVLRAQGATEVIAVAEGSDTKILWGNETVASSKDAENAPAQSTALIAFIPRGNSYRSCNLCGSDDIELLYEKPFGQIVRCRRCGYVYRADIPDLSIYDENYYEHGGDRNTALGYSGYTTDQRVDRQKKAAGQVAMLDEAYQRFSPGARTKRHVDVGAVVGYVVNAALDAGWDSEGIEPSAYPLRRAAALKSEGKLNQRVRLHLGTLADARYPDGSKDVISYFDTLEHVADPKQELTEASRVLRDGGLAVMVVPDFDSEVSRAQKENWKEVHADHISYFTQATLTRFLEETGFEVVEVRRDSLTEEEIREIRAGKETPRGSKMTVIARKISGEPSPDKAIGQMRSQISANVAQSRLVSRAKLDKVLQKELPLAIENLRNRDLVPGVTKTLPEPLMPGERIIAVGDLHGELRALLTVFLSAGVIDSQLGDWIGGSFIAIGDVINRGFRHPLGRYPLESIAFLDRAQKQARVLGSDGVILAGNTEMRVLMRNRRQVEPYLQNKERFNALREELLQRIKEGNLVMAWHAAGLLFAHSFVLADHVQPGETLTHFVERANAVLREYGLAGDFVHSLLDTKYGVMWFDPDESMVLPMAFDMVYGHNERKSGLIELLFGGRVVNIDVGFTAGHLGYAVLEGGLLTAYSLQPRIKRKNSKRVFESS